MAPFYRSKVMGMRTLSMLLITVFLICLGCASKRISRELNQVDQIKNMNSRQEYIKAHLFNGNIYVLHSWKIDEVNNTLSGFGNYLDFNRRILDSRGADPSNKKTKGNFAPFIIPLDEIVIVETNDKGDNPGVAAMVVIGLTTTTLSLSCVINPKACFGSCPTFYVQEDTVSRLVAEGFSSSISRSLEEKDIDLVDFRLDEGDPLQINVKNEALETHMIQSINILVCEKNPDNRVLLESSGDFYEVSDIQSPKEAWYKSTSILPEIIEKDEKEWFSLSDSFNLAKKEDIFLEFNHPGKSIGLIIDKRQSLMTTFLFYHFLSLMGQATPYYITEMETRKPWIKNRINRMYDQLGGIEVSILDPDNRWRTLTTVREAGPIVSDTHLIQLPEINSSSVKIRLRMTQGLWRINSLNLATLEQQVYPKRIKPHQVLNGSEKKDEILEKLLGKEYLVTFPGDEYTIGYPVSYTATHEYFIESQGYYIEWMREEWLKDENFGEARKVLFNPSRYLKKMATAYKVQEPEMEKAFWDSRYTKNEK